MTTAFPGSTRAKRLLAAAALAATFLGPAGDAAAWEERADHVRVVRIGGSVVEGLLVEVDDSVLLVQDDWSIVPVPARDVAEIEIVGQGLAVPDLEPAIPEGEQWVVLKLEGGAAACGRLLAIEDDVVRVLVRGREVPVTRGDIASMEFGDADDPPPGLAVVARRGNEPSRAPRSGGEQPQRRSGAVEGGLAQLDDVVLGLPPGVAERYRNGRIELRNGRHRPIGPEDLGFSERDFGRDDEDSHFAWIGGRRLRAPELAGDLGDAALQEAIERRLAHGRAKTGIGICLAGTGTGLIAAVAIAAGVEQNTGAEPTAEQVLASPALVAWGVGFSVAGHWMAGSGSRALARALDADLSDLLPRREAWDLVQRYNGDLRAELDLPDDEALDTPLSPIPVPESPQTPSAGEDEWQDLPPDDEPEPGSSGLDEADTGL